jgi:hypothetical protein
MHRMSEQALTPDSHPYPTRSKMVDTYLADIAWKLATAQVREARILAVRLPHIGVALSSAELHSAPEAYQRWCAEWVEPARSAEDYAQWLRDADDGATTAEQTPFAALQALRLRRSIREIAAPQVPSVDALPPADRPAAEDCEALLHAARKWYSQAGRHDSIVQSNLARLGVLR